MGATRGERAGARMGAGERAGQETGGKPRGSVVERSGKQNGGDKTDLGAAVRERGNRFWIPENVDNLSC